MSRYIIVSGAPWGDRVCETLMRQNPGRPFGGQLEFVGTEMALWDAIQKEPAPRYVFFLNWSRLVPQWIIEGHECVNFHCTDLPYGRGGGPIENLLLRGHTETTITAHRMTMDLDAGPVYHKWRGISLAGATKAEILARFVHPVEQMIVALCCYEPQPIPQEGEPVVFRRLTQESYEAFWRTRAQAHS